MKIIKKNFDDSSNAENHMERSSSTSNKLLILPDVSLIDRPTQSTANIRVVCRFRPLNQKEKNLSQNLCVDFLDNQSCSIKSSVLYNIIKAENKLYKFNFDRIFDVNCNQQEVYENSVKTIIDSIRFLT